MSVIVVATGNLAGPGGSETYVMTVAEHLTRLGHSVTLLARNAGAVAQLAETMGIPVEQDLARLPMTVDAVFVLDREFALALGGRYPSAARVFVIHNVDESYLPPPAPGCIHATVVLNERHEERARATCGAGTVVRLRQPIDTQRFSPREPIANAPLRAAWLGNYGGFPGKHRERLREAWGDRIEWVEIGGPQATMDVPEELANVDIVVGYGRSIIEAMSCARAAYVFEHVGAAGWVTVANYREMESDGFAGIAVRPPADVAQLRLDLAAYSPDLGWQGRELVLRNHSAREHVCQLMILADSIAPELFRADENQLEALSSMARLNLLLAHIAYARLIESQVLSQHVSGLNRHAADAASRRTELEGVATAQAAAITGLERENARLAAAIDAIYLTRRYRFGAALARPLERLRRRLDR